MKGELKPGGLALVVGCVRNPINIGKCVELIQFVNPGEYFKDDLGNTGRMIDTDVKGAWLCFGDVHRVDGAGNVYKSGHTLTASEHLMPLDGDPDEIETKEKEKELTK